MILRSSDIAWLEKPVHPADEPLPKATETMVLAGANARWTARRIADEHGVCIFSVHKRARELGIDLRKTRQKLPGIVKMLREGKSYDEVAKIAGTTAQWARSVSRRMKRGEFDGKFLEDGTVEELIDGD